MTPDEFERHRQRVQTASGPVGYADTGGDGPPVLFLHGLATSGYLWRHVVERLDRRCVVPDLPLHGTTPAAPDQDFTLPGLARFVGDFCDALDLDGFHLVANDTGGAIAQTFAARNAHRLATLTLTNCETHGNLPPRALLPVIMLARAGLLARTAPRMLRDLPRARRRVYGSGYQDVRTLPEEVVRAYLEPIFGTRESARRFERFLLSLHARDLPAIDPDLARLRVPTLIVWGTADKFFPLKWAYRLRNTIPGVTKVVELEGAKLFFPDERAADLAAALIAHWAAQPGGHL
ncbi:alpha/beta fold hydrolase [Actinomadura sp. NPDC000600]|uniref:alpha/beta fold hydrolase n=1 Tax=Actinomadura sp. NPDC000600 TaxID=3154262 RepID=UPI00339468F4